MEMFELVAPPDLGHKDPDDKCPFCPPEPPPKFTTHPGAANDSAILERLLNKPDTLLDEQSNARPQETGAGLSPKPEPIHSCAPYGDYSCEAHHLISGNQALKGHVFEDWILERGRVKSDSGYSINNAMNGIWAPSIPNKYKSAKWGPLDGGLKYNISVEVMAKSLIQFHKGPHNIRDPADTGDTHRTYPAWLKGQLETMNKRMELWSERCFLCEAARGKNEKPQPSRRINQVLNSLSHATRTKITGSAMNWEIFISRLALAYHVAAAHPERPMVKI